VDSEAAAERQFLIMRLKVVYPKTTCRYGLSGVKKLQLTRLKASISSNFTLVFDHSSTFGE